MCICKNFNCNIVLCGFMGCGKTTVGKRLAQKIGFNFIDTDSCIENATELKIDKIFDLYGEKFFRNLERTCVNVVSKLSHTVISTGGGTILDANNVYNLKQNGKIFYLDVPIEVITARLNADSPRPLIKNKNSIIELFNTRKEKYLSVADYVVDASLSINCICESVTKSLNL